MTITRISNNNFIAVYTLGNSGHDAGVADEEITAPYTQASWVPTQSQRQFIPTETIHSSRLVCNLTGNTNTMAGANIISRVGDPISTFSDGNQIIEIGTGSGVFQDVAGGIDVVEAGVMSFQWEYNAFDGVFVPRGISSRAQTVAL